MQNKIELLENSFELEWNKHKLFNISDMSRRMQNEHRTFNKEVSKYYIKELYDNLILLTNNMEKYFTDQRQK